MKPKWFVRTRKKSPTEKSEQAAPAKPADTAADRDADAKNAAMQGSYTDYHMRPYTMRQQIEPLYGPELEAFNWVIDQMQKQNPEVTKMSDLVDAGLDAGFFITGPQGELRVAQELP